MRTWNHMLLAANHGPPRNAHDTGRSALHVRLLTKRGAPRYAREIGSVTSKTARAHTAITSITGTAAAHVERSTVARRSPGSWPMDETQRALAEGSHGHGGRPVHAAF